MELFDKRFVHFMWDDELKGKTGHVSNDIKCLCDYVNNNPSATELIEHSSDESQPFKTTDGIRFRFFYYDPNYEVKKAFNEGKTIQCRRPPCLDWVNTLNPTWDPYFEYRATPEEAKKWIAYLARPKNGDCYLSACTDTYWESAQKEFGAKTKLFIGTYDEVSGWFESRQKFAEVIKAWEDGKTIQYKALDTGRWCDFDPKLGPCLWNDTIKYRVKPKEKKYRPYINSAEMIADFKDRFKVNCPSYAEPLIWVKGEATGTTFLIFAFYGTFIKFNDDAPVMFKELFTDYTYLDGSPCGMEENKE